MSNLYLPHKRVVGVIMREVGPTRALKLRQRPWDFLLGSFFLLHPFVIVFIGAQILFPRDWFRTWAQELLAYHLENYGDFLIADPPLYYKSFMVAELLFQLPLYIVNAYAFFLGRRWGRMTGIIWGVHVATTMIPILGQIVMTESSTCSTLLGIYIPYMVIPIVVLVRLIPYTDPFAAVTSEVSSSEQKKTKKI